MYCISIQLLSNPYDSVGVFLCPFGNPKNKQKILKSLVFITHWESISCEITLKKCIKYMGKCLEISNNCSILVV